MATSFQTTELDFTTIKNNLKTYLERQDEFADYDFEASGLNNILDVLAYNTHFNALMANFGLNEAYLVSAQLRSSVISIAQSLGYNIRSRRASTAELNLSLNLSGAGTKPTSVTLPAGTKFTTSVDGVNYTFQTYESYTATDDGTGIFTFVTSSGSTDIPVYEGTRKTKTFIVQEEDDRQVFVIPDETIDTSLVTVKVYDTYNSTSFTSYTDILNAISIDAESTFFRITETPNRFYELSFGDGITIGQKPTVGNKITLQYFSCVGPDANSATAFSPVSQVTVNNVDYDLAVTVSSSSYGGALRQGIESIRQNAPLGFASQNRLVTAGDYKTKILTNYSSVQDAVAWGGEDHDPPDYGVVFVGLLFEDGISEANKESVKNSITNTLNENLAILSIDISFVDPVITYLEITTRFNFNPNKTSVTRSTIESRVNSAVSQYVEDNLKTFSGIFRKSNLLFLIDDVSDAILSSSISVKINQRLTPVSEATEDNSSSASNYTLSYPVRIATPDDVEYRVTSTFFTYDGQRCSVKNRLNSTTLQIVDVDNNVVVDNIGSYNADQGKVNLVGFSPGVISSGDSYIKFTVTPANDNALKPLRNYYFDNDPEASSAIAVIDREETSTTLS